MNEELYERRRVINGVKRCENEALHCCRMGTGFQVWFLVMSIACSLSTLTHDEWIPKILVLLIALGDLILSFYWHRKWDAIRHRWLEIRQSYLEILE